MRASSVRAWTIARRHAARAVFAPQVPPGTRERSLCAASDNVEPNSDAQQAAPHVTGIAALALSKFGKVGTAGLLALLTRRATSTACPPGNYQPYPDDMPAEKCVGVQQYNGFYGLGQADALATVR